MENNVKENEIKPSFIKYFFNIAKNKRDVPDIILYSWNFFKIDKNREKQFDVAKRRQL